MKYFLAVDRGSLFKLNERFIALDMGDIHEKLTKDNNLKELCTFTMNFENQTVLKDFLLKKNILGKNIANYDLKIIYRRNYIRFLSVPYSKDKKYFDIGYLGDIIAKNAYDSNFLKVFLAYFQNDVYKSDEYDELKKAFFEYAPQYILFDKIRSFLNCKVYPVKDGKTSFSYRSLYEIAMLVSNLLEKKESRKENIQKKAEVDSNFTHLTETQQFELEELLSRKKDDNDQISLFRM